MAKLVKYPEVNPIQFVPVASWEAFEASRYNFPHYNEWWQCERTLLGEQNVYYHQKIQQNDSIQLEFHSNNNGTSGATVKVYDSNWNYMVDIGTSTTLVTGFEITDDIDGTSYTAHTHIVDDTINDLGLADGFYFFVIEVPFASGEPVYMVSEPIFLRDKHPNTVLLEYSNSVNNFDVFFKTHELTFRLRVEGKLHSLSPQSVDTTYEDELVDITLLDSVPFNTYTFSTRAVPEWMVNKLNRTFSCDRVRIDHPYKYWVKDKDAKVELTGNPNSTKKGFSLAVRQAYSRYSIQSNATDGIEVWRILNNGDSGTGSRFPYFLHTARLTRSGAPNVELMVLINGVNTIGAYSTDCKEVRDASDEALVLNHANNVTRATYGQLGYYALVGLTGGGMSLVYYPHPTETNYIAGVNVVLSRHTKVTFQTGAYGSGQYYDVQGSYIGYGMVRASLSHFSGKYGTGNPSITYLVGGSSINLINDVARIYHHRQSTNTSTVTKIIAQYSAQTPNIVAFAARSPVAMWDFRVSTGSSGSMTNFDWSYMLDCSANIFNVALHNNQIAIITNMDNLFIGGLLPQLGSYAVNMNKLPASGPTGVDRLFQDMWNGGGGNQVYGAILGFVTTKNQTPAAPPTASSLAARTGIAGDGWIISTD